MTTKTIILLFSSAILFFGCSNKKRAAEVAGYSYTEKSIPAPGSKVKIPGDWVKEGAVCYGLIVAVDKEGKQLSGKPVKAEVVKITDSEIKMKALESVSLAEVKGCTKMGLAKGDGWSEQEGDLFQTKEEAIEFLKKNNLYKQKREVTTARE